PRDATTLSLHDALPISNGLGRHDRRSTALLADDGVWRGVGCAFDVPRGSPDRDGVVDRAGDEEDTDEGFEERPWRQLIQLLAAEDRKSTRLNSSHQIIS